jgi:hypothetical protein
LIAKLKQRKSNLYANISLCIKEKLNKYEETLDELVKYKESREQIKNEIEKLWQVVSSSFGASLVSISNKNQEEIILRIITNNIVEKYEEYKKELKELKYQLKEKEVFIARLRNNQYLIDSKTPSPFNIKEKIKTMPSEKEMLQSLTRENLETMEEEKLCARYEGLVSNNITLIKSADKYCGIDKELNLDIEDLNERNKEIIVEREELKKRIKSLATKLKKYEADSSFLVSLVYKRIDR